MTCHGVVLLKSALLLAMAAPARADRIVLVAGGAAEQDELRAVRRRLQPAGVPLAGLEIA